MSASDHGSASTYTNWACRCDACRIAHSASRQARRVQRYEELAAGAVIEHDNSGYTNWGCRCATCREAHTEFGRQRRLKKQAVAS